MISFFIVEVDHVAQVIDDEVQVLDHDRQHLEVELRLIKFKEKVYFLKRISSRKTFKDI
jgi:hypothetical protein